MAFIILAAIIGLWALISGKLKVSSKRMLEGRDAKLAGIFLISSIPIGYFLEFYFAERGSSFGSVISGCSCWSIILVVAYAYIAGSRPKTIPEQLNEEEKLGSKTNEGDIS